MVGLFLNYIIKDIFMNSEVWKIFVPNKVNHLDVGAFGFFVKKAIMANVMDKKYKKFEKSIIFL